MISNAKKMLLYIHPKNTSSEPLVDQLTRKMAAAFRQGKMGEGYRGDHECTAKGCGVHSHNCDYDLPNGLQTNSLCVHYLAFHRDEVPETELEKVRALNFGEEEPNAKELAAPRRKSGGGDDREQPRHIIRGYRDGER